MKLKPLSQQVIVVTGASSGIGLVTARKAAAAGASVFLVARNGSALAAIVAGIEATGGRAAFAVADVGNRSQLSAAADAAIACFGRIDSWVNNAGVAIYAPLLETPLDEHERLFRTNYFGTVNGCQVAAAHLESQGGALITVGSIAGDMPSPIMGAYAASKHAVGAFVRSLRIELTAARAPISLTLIKPSGMATPIAAHAANHQDGEARIPPPAYDPELVADAILHAAVHPAREMTIGGVGRAQTLFAAHFPALFERLAPAVIPLLLDRSRAPALRDNLHTAGTDGKERSATERGRRMSLYTSARLNPGLATAVAFGAAAVGFALSRRAAEARRPRSATVAGAVVATG